MDCKNYDQVHSGDSIICMYRTYKKSALYIESCAVHLGKLKRSLKVCVTWSLFYIDFDEFDWCHFTGTATTHSNLNVVSCGGGQLHIEPR